MGFLSAGGASPSSLLLCEENMDDVFGCSDGEGELAELGAGLDFPAFPLESDEVVASLMEKEKEQLIHVAAGHYLQRLNSGGVVSSWRIASIDWINKAQAHHNFGPLCFYLSINYLDRILSIKEPQVSSTDVCSEKYKFDAESIKNMEIFVMGSLNWRMQAVTPFSYINYFMDKFTQGKPLSCGFASRCSELILGTLEATKFLQFRPSEIAAAAVLLAAAESHALDFTSALIASNIPIDKQTVKRCYEAMQEVGLVKKNEGNASRPSVPKSPYGVLGASCFSFKTDDSQTPGSSQANHVYNPANKRT
ncbi:hypothetical protein PAHAL_9G441800 [Panicum hallii]|uniref:Cyclin C-terminal domain-containing protein n=1 Tax=Panicum hallii TaxID=206008 RepID=A0A2T8I4L0_9POAL|nr:hypothetical protein PAHAL_9G441800 [Panicum hallii]